MSKEPHHAVYKEDFLLSAKCFTSISNDLIRELEEIEGIKVLEGNLEVGLHVVIPEEKYKTIYTKYSRELIFGVYGLMRPF